ncbi:MAG: tagatose 1,6-diphosphate aldolase [Acidobacteria bacterium]|nr:tagatose 1,6-diphosphate aldolase [Acidobacteriota bacterium]
MRISEGKRRGLEAVSNKDGVIAAAAMDQRGSLHKSIAQGRGVPTDQVKPEALTEFKVAVTKILTPHASAILLDPEYSLPAVKVVAKNAGVLLAYEKSGYDKTGPGRLPDLLPEWSVRRLVEAGANSIKLLMYYTPFDPPAVNEIKHAFIERIGAECAATDVPFFLEFIGYEEGKDENGPEYAAKKPEVVTKSMAEFSKDRYGVDVLKVEVPVNMKYVEGTKAFKGPRVWTRAQAKEAFQNAASVARRPFIYLSAGVSNEVFTETLELAAESGVNWCGVLCGRATWKDGVPVYAKGGVKALEDWLADQGVKNIQAVNDRLKTARPWYSFYGVESATALR